MSDSALEMSQEARRLWLKAGTQDDLDHVESLLRAALNAKQSSKSATTKKDKKKRQRQQYAELTKSDYRKAGERLSLLYCQSGRTEKAKYGLQFLGFTCRLAKSVLDYPHGKKRNLPIQNSKKSSKKKSQKNSKNTTNCPCIILDNFLHKFELEHLQGVFEDRRADYWASHSYQVEPPSPYFSYVIDLKSSENHGGKDNQLGFIGQLARLIRKLPELQAKFPELRQTRYVELWGHNRPHASGHQLHFDSDDEGRGGEIRNPVCSTILYLTNCEDNSNNQYFKMVGGPSLVTNQRLTSTTLATKGWLAHPKPLRLVAFDGRVLHGVIPGKGVQIGRRTTLMMAFWKHIKIRDEPTQGSARPFPLQTAGKNDQPVWAMQLTDSNVKVPKGRPNSMKEEAPISLSTVYETLDGEPWKPEYGMPDYEDVFQGF